MTSTDYILDIALILSIFKTVREREFSLHSLLLPLGLVAFAVSHYLTSIPTGGNDVALYVVLGSIGLVLGTLCGLATKMRADETGTVLSQAGVAAIVLWCVGMVSRAGFSFWTSHGGEHAVTQFSIDHAITSGAAWTTALLLMAIIQVAAKFAVQIVRSRVLAEPAVA